MFEVFAKVSSRGCSYRVADRKGGVDILSPVSRLENHDR